MGRGNAAEKAVAPEGEQPEVNEGETPAVPEEDLGVPVEEKAVAPEGEVTVKMAIGISGLHDGEQWPAVGGEITLSAEDAERFIRLGYAVSTE